jgi:uncharacterized protein
LEPITEQISEAALLCRQCNATLKSDERFCGYCGTEIAIYTPEPHHAEVFNILQPTLIYYFGTLILLATYKLTNLFPEGFEGLVIVSAIDIAIVVGFWIHARNQLRDLFDLSKLDLRVLLLTIGGAAAAAVLVGWIADLIGLAIHDDVYYSPYLYEDTGNPWLWAVLMTCVQPAIFEEVSFRGFMFSNVQAFASPRGAIYVSAVLFGIMHLSFISLLWLIPLGIVFASLRLRYNTLWYGIIGHFVYNFTVTLIEFVAQG